MLAAFGLTGAYPDPNLRQYRFMLEGLQKILEWRADPETALRTVIHLNNGYFLDGRNASSYANVAWTFGVHDRRWPDRPVFGKLRYMNAKGLERKCEMAAYLRAVDEMVDAEPR